MGNTNGIINIIKEIGIIITPIILAFIAYKQIKLGTGQKALKDEVNGKITKLLESKDAESLAKQETAKVTGEQKGAADNQAATDAKPQENK